VSLFEYDYDDLAQQIQNGLERIAVNFLRAHGARVRRDLVDFHGYEQIDLELTHGGHTLKVHQVGRPRGPGYSPSEPPPAGLEEEFESTFDGWPASNTPLETIAQWLASLPAGEAPPEAPRAAKDASNPFAKEGPARTFDAPKEPAFNPFLADRPEPGGRNPFADPDRERRRQEMLRRLGGEDEE
jgi:hypothetical protein